MLGHAFPVREEIFQHIQDLTGDIMCRLVAESKQLAVIWREVVLLTLDGGARILHRTYFGLQAHLRAACWTTSASPRMLYVSSN